MTVDAGEKDGAAVRFPPPLIPLIVILAGIGLEFAWPLNVGVELPAPGRYWAGGGIVAVAMAVLGVWPVLMFRRSGQSVIPWTKTPELLARGPYRFTRNPMYLQMILVCIGISVILASAWILLLTPACAWLLNVIAIRPEEAYLKQKFGDAYLEYMKRVRRWI